MYKSHKKLYVSRGPFLETPDNFLGPFLETPDNFLGPKTILGAQYSWIAIQFLLILNVKF